MVNFTVIIPHYNIPELLMRCLRSVPVREDIQVIVVDDCSPDASRYLVDYSELSRPYLEFYSTPKGGSAGRARNIGLEHAKGKWLVFADADDFFVDDFEKILDDHVDDDEDIIFFNIKSVSSADITKNENRDERSSMIEDYMRNGDTTHFRVCCPPPWGKMIKKSLIDNHRIRFDETRWSNDQFFSALSGALAATVKIENTNIYVVTERENSLSYGLRQKDCVSSSKECIVRLKVAMKVQSLLDKMNIVPPFSIYFHYAMVLLHNYPIQFFIHFVPLFFQYPTLCVMIVDHWWKEKRKSLH